jgi:hypothetical protein
VDTIAEEFDPSPIRPVANVDAFGPSEPSGHAPRVESAVPDGLDVLFGDFDPFSAPAAAPYRSSDSLAWSDPVAPDDVAHDETTITAFADSEDLARQMAVLSPRAAQAVAAAVQDATPPPAFESPDLEPEGREHVLRFLDSVQ